MKITCLNIQGGWKIKEISEEISHKLAPFDILALQEVKEVGDNKQITKILNTLGNGYKFTDWYPTTFGNEKYGRMGNAIIFNTRINLVSQDKIKIPDFKPNIAWTILRRYFQPIQRLAISAKFEYKSKTIRVTNVHLEYSGGSGIRKRQIKYLLDKLSDDDVDKHILMGDFNTLGKLDRKLLEIEFLKENKFKLLSENIKWTADNSNPDPNWYPYPIFKFLYKLGFKMRQNLDHVLIKGKVGNIKCRKVKIDSSDHDAIVCGLDL